MGNSVPAFAERPGSILWCLTDPVISRSQPTYKCEDKTIWISLAEASLGPHPVRLRSPRVAQPYNSVLPPNKQPT